MLNNKNTKHKSTKDVPIPRRDSLQCSVCKKLSTSKLHICYSGHIICDTCNQDEGSKTMKLNYKNGKYTDSKSSTDVFSAIKNHSSESQDIKPMQRPVSCPVTECRKMIALDSVLQHFFFDHSKVSRLYLKDTTPCEMNLRVSNLSRKSRCVVILLNRRKIFVDNDLRKVESFALFNERFKNESPMLLMGARYSKCNSSTSKNISTQTVDNFLKYSDTFRKNKVSFSTTTNLDTRINNEKEVDNDDDYLLWMCKVNDNMNCYSVTVLKNDNRLGHSYIGEAIHIREQQDASAIHQRAECLIIKSIAMKKILYNDNLKLYINILN